jgi:hypothetical protein
MFDTNYLDRLCEWSRITFGEGKRTFGITKKIEGELGEICSDPNDLMEWVDVIMLAMDGFYRAGGNQDRLGEMLEEKLRINRKRTYPKPIGDEAVQHEEEKPGSHRSKDV